MLDIVIITVFFIINIIIGLYSGRHLSSFREYSVWKRSFGSFAICSTLAASFIGGGYVMGNAAKVYSIGMVYAFGLLGFSFKEVLVGLFVAPRMNKYNDCHSVGDIMGRHFGGQAKLITGIFSLLICAGILGAQVSAMGAMFSAFFHVPEITGIVIGFGIIIFYASAGGMRGIVYTDIFQFLIIVIGIPLIFVFGLKHIGGWQSIEQHIAQTHINPFINSEGRLQFLGLFLTFMLGEILIPPYVQRLFMAQSVKQTKRATLMAGFVSVPIFLIAGAIGLIAYVVNDQLDPNLSIPYVINECLPIGVKGIVISGLIAVIMSSAAGFLNAASISFVNDILPSISKQKNVSSKSLLSISRAVSVIIGVTAIGFALSINNILDILIYSYSLWSPVILIPLLAAIFDVKSTIKVFYISACAGILVTIVGQYLCQDIYYLTSNVMGVCASLITFLCINKRYVAAQDKGLCRP